MGRTITILAGVALIVAGIAWIYPPAGLITAGILALLTDYATHQEPPQ